VIQSDSKACGCLIPQHGPGRKHERKIDLAEWQQAIVNREPEQLVRGLIHSDRCRVINRVVVNGKEYAYPRYFFAQVSTDIQGSSAGPSSRSASTTASRHVGET
jgi:hypothetical protein